VKGQGHQGALLTAALTHRAAAAVIVGTYWPWEPIAMLRSALCRRGGLGGARRCTNIRVMMMMTDSETAYSCSGQFQKDFIELCRRVTPPFIYTPAVVLRPHRPQSPTPGPVTEERSTKPGRQSVKDTKVRAIVVDHDKTDSPLQTEHGGALCNVFLLCPSPRAGGIKR